MTGGLRHRNVTSDHVRHGSVADLKMRSNRNNVNVLDQIAARRKPYGRRLQEAALKALNHAPIGTIWAQWPQISKPRCWLRR